MQQRERAATIPESRMGGGDTGRECFFLGTRSSGAWLVTVQDVTGGEQVFAELKAQERTCYADTK